MYAVALCCWPCCFGFRHDVVAMAQEFWGGLTAAIGSYVCVCLSLRVACVCIADFRPLNTHRSRTWRWCVLTCGHKLSAPSSSSCRCWWCTLLLPTNTQAAYHQLYTLYICSLYVCIYIKCHWRCGHLDGERALAVSGQSWTRRDAIHCAASARSKRTSFLLFICVGLPYSCSE